jgi:hypothetical protein
VSAGWVAGTVRAHAMATRRLGAGGARALATAPSLADALMTLAASPYGRDVTPGQSLPEAQRGVADTLLWNLRVFAGWLPRGGGDRVRVLAGWFEIADVEEVLRRLAGETFEPPFRMGGLATVTRRLEAVRSPADLRRLLTASPWGDPGGESPADVVPALQLAWAERVAAAVPPARDWAVAGAALLVARVRFLGDRPLGDAARASSRRLLGSRAADAGSLVELATVVPRAGRAALAGAVEPEALWRAEARWWQRLALDAGALLRQPRFSLDPVVGTVAAAAVDAWRVRAALECAARGGQGLEVFDAIA